jgi:hypothetical protein
MCVCAFCVLCDSLGFVCVCVKAGGLCVFVLCDRWGFVCFGTAGVLCVFVCCVTAGGLCVF